MTMEQIGCGCTRRVYAIDDNYVLKVAYNDDGKEQCEREYNLYQQEEYRPYLAEIVGYDADKGEIKAERLCDCCYMKKDNADVKAYFPESLLNNVCGKVVQVGYDKSRKLKIFDYGQEISTARTISKEQKDEMWKYHLPKRDKIYE